MSCERSVGPPAESECPSGNQQAKITGPKYKIIALLNLPVDDCSRTSLAWPVPLLRDGALAGILFLLTCRRLKQHHRINKKRK